MFSSISVSWPFVLETVNARALDRVEVLTPDKRARIIDAEGTEQVAAALEYVRANVAGPVCVVAWSGDARKASAFTWSVGADAAPVQGVAGAGANVVPYLEQVYAAKLEIARLEMEREQGEGTVWERIASLAETLTPVILAKLTGQPVGAVVNPAAGGGSGADGLPDHELSAMLADVAAFARANPEQARQYIAALRQMSSANGEA